MEYLLACFISVYLPIGSAFTIVTVLSGYQDIWNANLSGYRTLVEFSKLTIAAIFYGIFWPITLIVIIKRSGITLK